MSFFLYNTLGLDTLSSKFSLLIVSTKIPICNSPLPPISNESLLSFSVKVIATFESASERSLSLILVEVTFFSSNPANGELFTVIVTAIVGGSIAVAFIGVLIL